MSKCYSLETKQFQILCRNFGSGRGGWGVTRHLTIFCCFRLFQFFLPIQEARLEGTVNAKEKGKSFANLFFIWQHPKFLSQLLM